MLATEAVALQFPMVRPHRMCKVIELSDDVRFPPMKTPLRKLLLGLIGLTCMSLTAHAAEVTHQPFGKTKDGTPVEIYTLRNAHGCEARITNYGGIVVSLTMPDKNGKMDDVLLGFDTVGEYEKDSPYFGALIGRYGNRIAKGKFVLEGKSYTLATNDPPNALHGGKAGFDKRVWEAKGGSSPEGPTLTLHYVSKDGEEGYPGTLTVQAVYTLTEQNALKISFEATTDAPTVLNLTSHAYFDLRGQAEKGDLLDHVVTLPASKYLPVDRTSIPLGELRPVAGTPFDFTKPMSIGSRINDPDEQLHIGPGGYDHCYVLDGYDAKLGSKAEPFLAAHVLEPKSGRVLELWTSEPGVQFYTGNFLEGKFAGKGGKMYVKRSAFCLEPQHFPNSPNRPEYPSVELKPGETYRNTFEYRFSVQR